MSPGYEVESECGKGQRRVRETPMSPAGGCSSIKSGSESTVAGALGDWPAE